MLLLVVLEVGKEELFVGTRVVGGVRVAPFVIDHADGAVFREHVFIGVRHVRLIAHSSHLYTGFIVRDGNPEVGVLRAYERSRPINIDVVQDVDLDGLLVCSHPIIDGIFLGRPAFLEAARQPARAWIESGAATRVLLTQLLVFVLAFACRRETAPVAVLALWDIFVALEDSFVGHQVDLVPTVLQVDDSRL